MTAEEDYLTLSGLQHFTFCRRQWALIFIERQWAENLRTVDGHLFHERAHDAQQTEKRGGTLITRGMRVVSHRLCVTGVCDIVEFHQDEKGVTLFGWEGRWQPYPVEYKKGAPNAFGADELQLCGQAMCLEEMLACEIPEGSLFYGEPRRRVKVAFTAELREKAEAMLAGMHDLYRRGYTPKVKPTKSCNACSLKEVCLPKLQKTTSVQAYLQKSMEDGG